LATGIDRSNLSNEEVHELFDLGIDWEQRKNTNNENSQDDNNDFMLTQHDNSLANKKI
jgi:hypothetical protein